MKRECLHPHEIPVEVVAKLPGMHWGEVLFTGLLVSGLVSMVGMVFYMTHETAFREGQAMGEYVEPDPIRLDLDPPRSMFRSLSIYDNYYYIDGTKIINRY